MGFGLYCKSFLVSLLLSQFFQDGLFHFVWKKNKFKINTPVKRTNADFSYIGWIRRYVGWLFWYKALIHCWQKNSRKIFFQNMRFSICRIHIYKKIHISVILLLPKIASSWAMSVLFALLLAGSASTVMGSVSTKSTTCSPYQEVAFRLRGIMVEIS